MKFPIKMTPIKWVIAIIVIYYLFIRENKSEVEFEDVPDVITDPAPQGRMANPNDTIMATGKAKRKCRSTKCKVVISRGVLGIGRKVEKGWCRENSSGNCTCLGASCKRRGENLGSASTGKNYSY